MSARMADINEAYGTLSDPVRRAAYDRAFKDRYQSKVSKGAEPSAEEIVVGLMQLAAEKAAEGKSKSQVADELTREGVPYDLAAQVTDRVFAYRSEFKRKEGRYKIDWMWVVDANCRRTCNRDKLYGSSWQPRGWHIHCHYRFVYSRCIDSAEGPLQMVHKLKPSPANIIDRCSMPTSEDW